MVLLQEGAMNNRFGAPKAAFGEVVDRMVAGVDRFTANARGERLCVCGSQQRRHRGLLQYGPCRDGDCDRFIELPTDGP